MIVTHDSNMIVITYDSKNFFLAKPIYVFSGGALAPPEPRNEAKTPQNHPK